MKALAALGRVREAALASVASPGQTGMVVDVLRELGVDSIVTVQSAPLALDVHNAYTEPARLGVDRWAAMVAAYRMTGKTVCVVDCGTAITLDVVDATGRHLGGVIAPGLGMMKKGLLGTANIAHVDGDFSGLLATNTSDGVSAGCLHAAAGLVDRLVARLALDIQSGLTCLLTGGDAQRLAPCLATSCRVVDDLVLLGIALLAEEEK